MTLWRLWATTKDRKIQNVIALAETEDDAISDAEKEYGLHNKWMAIQASSVNNAKIFFAFLQNAD
jgi:hypothetical protein